MCADDGAFDRTDRNSYSATRCERREIRLRKVRDCASHEEPYNYAQMSISIRLESGVGQPCRSAGAPYQGARPRSPRDRRLRWNTRGSGHLPSNATSTASLTARPPSRRSARPWPSTPGRVASSASPVRHGRRGRTGSGRGSECRCWRDRRSRRGRSRARKRARSPWRAIAVWHDGVAGPRALRWRRRR